MIFRTIMTLVTGAIILVFIVNALEDYMLNFEIWQRIAVGFSAGYLFGALIGDRISRIWEEKK